MPMQVTNLFAVSSRFGTPDDFKRLVDEAHCIVSSAVHFIFLDISDLLHKMQILGQLIFKQSPK